MNDGFERSLQAAAAAIALAANREAAESPLPIPPVQASVAEDSAKEQRIAELRKLYQRGEYEVDASAITARIIDEHLI